MSTFDPLSIRLGPPRVQARPRHPFLAYLEQNACSRSIEDYEMELLTYFDQLQEFDRPNAQMIENQPELDWCMRPSLIDFFLELNRVFGLSSDVLFLAIHIMDRYCSKRIVLKKHFQLVTTTAFWIAAKFEDKASKLPRLNQLVTVCSNLYDGYMFLQMESHMLTTLHWKVKACFTVLDALELCFQQASFIWPKTDVKFLKSTSNFFIELSCYDKHYMAFNSSIKAVSGIIMASVLLNDNTFQHYISDLLHQFSKLVDRNYEQNELDFICSPLLRLNKNSAINIRRCCLLYLNDIFNPLTSNKELSRVLMKKYEKSSIESLIATYTSDKIETYLYLCKLTQALLDTEYDRNVLLTSINGITDKMIGLKLGTEMNNPHNFRNSYGQSLTSSDEYIVQTRLINKIDSDHYSAKSYQNSSCHITNTQSPMTPASLFSKSSLSTVSTEQDVEHSQELAGKINANGALSMTQIQTLSTDIQFAFNSP